MKTQKVNFLNSLSAFLNQIGLDLKSFIYLLTVKIPREIHDQILLDRGVYSLTSGNLNYIQPAIKLTEFNNYINNVPGFRIFPGLDKSSSGLGYSNFILMLGLAQQADAPTEVVKYFLFLQPKYQLMNSNDAIIEAIAKPYLVSYHSEVLISGAIQDNKPEYKKSRFYPTAEFQSYLHDLPANTDYDKCYVKIEIGFITTLVSKYLFELYPGEFPTARNDYHVGFTCVLTIIDEAGNPILPTSIEIATPCPPDCGSLTW